ncbi:aldo/keto reductase [Pigmentiphaga aceris]|uniref:Aldo/keto reductase n=1 Tax=Pigmentiphaga aceris TaxID=1940612 RepID=A0A5C0B7T1_9BURK|nr:aldo/keto reductase [Pigmentiphaga aceris]QEI09191.1 aldo/keto reductase [Pigmentiphaga aceris]
MSRADFLRLSLGGAMTLAAAPFAPLAMATPPTSTTAAGASPAANLTKIATRRIPVSGASLPVIGCGTYVGFDEVPGSVEYARLPGVLNTLFAHGGSVIDSSPMYGRAEQTTGELLKQSNSRGNAFVATKVWTSGREAGIRQMEESFRLLGVDRVDLMQVHNLVDWRTHLATLRDWKAAGRIGYIGVTHYTASAYVQLESVLKAEKPDFVQLNYAIDDREAAQRLLPLAADLGIAVLVNRPFGGGGLLRRVRDRPLPGWAAEVGATSWAQLLLKFVLANPAVTCAIPGTSRPEHMADNLAAGRAPLPDAGFWTAARIAAVTG